MPQQMPCDDSSGGTVDDSDAECLVCHRSPYALQNRALSLWIQCDRCDAWAHGPCVGIATKEQVAPEFYSCPRCQLAYREKTQNNLQVGDLVWARAVPRYWPAYLAKPKVRVPASAGPNSVFVVYYNGNAAERYAFLSKSEVEPLYADSNKNDLRHSPLQSLLEALLPWYRPSNDRALRAKRKQARLEEEPADHHHPSTPEEPRPDQPPPPSGKRRRPAPNPQSSADRPATVQQPSTQSAASRSRSSRGRRSQPGGRGGGATLVTSALAPSPIPAYRPTFSPPPPPPPPLPSAPPNATAESPKTSSVSASVSDSSGSLRGEAKEKLLRSFRPDAANVRLRLTHLVLHRVVHEDMWLNPDHTLSDVFAMFCKCDWRLPHLYTHYTGEDEERERKALSHWLAEWGQQGNLLTSAQRGELNAIVHLLGLRQHYSSKTTTALACCLGSVANEDPTICELPTPDLARIPVFLLNPTITAAEAIKAACQPDSPLPICAPPPPPFPTQYPLPALRPPRCPALPSTLHYAFRTDPLPSAEGHGALRLLYESMTQRGKGSTTAEGIFRVRASLGPNHVLQWPEQGARSLVAVKQEAVEEEAAGEGPCRTECCPSEPIHAVKEEDTAQLPEEGHLQKINEAVQQPDALPSCHS
eukprot:GGOE01041164.1.p1 GENE.GGOE01041164.1~~GGOE01041164.1.p1  ORF type:complete len:643 (-),score=120.65 GGOE01041164.1:89-2017(-)